MKELTLEIISPEGIVISEKTDSVTLPCLDGSLGIMAGHLPAVAALNAGEICYRSGESMRTFKISGGVADITRVSVSIFADI